MRRFRFFALLLLWWPLWNACLPQPQEASSLKSTTRAVIYGKDDRMYTADHPDKKLQALADAVTVQVTSSKVKIDSKTGT